MRGTIILLLALALSACSAEGIGIGTGGTFVVAVGNEQYRVRIDNALLATKARRMMSGAERQQIVTGEVARGDGGFNVGYAWHIKPSTIAFADVTMEVCDGRPSDVESDVDYWVDTVKVFCPWGGAFVSEVGR